MLAAVNARHERFEIPSDLDAKLYRLEMDDATSEERGAALYHIRQLVDVLKEIEHAIREGKYPSYS